MILDINNAIELVTTAARLNMTDFCQSCKTFIAENIADIFHQPGFIQLPADVLLDILPCDHLIVEELDLYQAVKAWLAAHGGEDPTSVIVGSNRK